MTDRYEKIRKALAMGPTPGPWELRDGRTDAIENTQGYPVCTVHYHPYERYGHGTRAAYIAACDPDTIRELLAERDALAAEVERLAEALRELEGCEQRDEALLRQALEALLGQRGEPDWHTGKQREAAIAALSAALAEPTCKQSLQVAEQQGPEHISSPKCWCEPELDFKDPETGAEVWVHRSMQ